MLTEVKGMGLMESMSVGDEQSSHSMRIQIQRLYDQKTYIFKNEKIAIYLSLGYRRRLQPSRERFQRFKTTHF
jgi:hypothetical protein